ncbi:Fur family transcriptional regulator [Sulfurimonas sp. HSL3-7]|uniref:Fur family transcriptional regulator n=1 Tax=Sulfonitrofixus jiaomeiensis TaxID=3131938 RepID=UPI0031F8F55D
MQFSELLRENTLKVTPQRMAILYAIEKAGHIDIDRLYDVIHAAYANISLATVYKNINQMYEKGILEVINVPKQKLCYEIAKEPHVHLACDICGSIIDMHQCLDQLIDSAEAKSGYRLEHSTVVLNGVCPDCQTKTS